MNGQRLLSRLALGLGLARAYTPSQRETSMTRKCLSVCSLVLVLALAGSAGAGELRLSIQNGRVSLSARDVTLRQILVEWERVGGTRIVNRDRVPGALLTIEFVDVPEGRALETLLRSTAGYMAAKRLEPTGGASQFSRIILMPGAAAVAPGGSAVASQGGSAPSMGSVQPGRPQVQRRVQPDGRVVTIMDDLQQPGDPDDTEDSPTPPSGAPGMMRPPFQGPPRSPQGQTANEPTLLDPADPQGSTATRPMPTVAGTVTSPGAVAVPAVKNPQAPPGPPKPPGR